MFRSRTFFRLPDALIAAAVAAASAWGFAAFRMDAGGKAVVYVGKARYGWYDLTGPRGQILVPTRIGEVRLEIGGGSARIAASPCRNQICVKTGTIRHSHSETVCVPAQVVVVIEGGGKTGSGPDSGTDAVTY